MRARRPYLFSDSSEVAAPNLTREILSYHLETLTKLKEEARFEQFAKRLAHKFISPNIRPQTGPSGGGDGKTDAETYPVASDIAATWFVGDPSEGANRIAFAFSAKEAWRQKVQADVAEIVKTGRDYKRIYFISNQLIPARQSAEVQDSLEEKHVIPVTILDRTWLLDRVFDDSSVDIVVETFGAMGSTSKVIKVLGPQDYKRQLELDEIESRIALGGEYPGSPYTMVDEAYRAAILSRNLEKPRWEIDGKFERAIRLAKQRGGTKQQLAVTYDFAWASNFWFDDFDALNSLYDDVEALAIGSDVSDDLERLTTLYSLLQTAVRFEMLDPQDAKLDDRAARLEQALQGLQEDSVRRNNAFHARSLALKLQLTRAVDVELGEFNFDELWEEFRQLIKEVEGLGTFPFEPLADAITELGDVFNSAKYDLLFEAVTDALVKRRAEGDAAERNSQRGFQKLKMKLPYEAIRWFGRAVGNLTKDEYQDELAEALIGSSVAYESAGLYWAARNYALAAATQEFQAFRRSDSLEEVNPGTLLRWMVTELPLGRVPYIVTSHHLGAIVRSNRALTTEQKQRSNERLMDADMWTGALLLRTRFEDLSQLSNFPESLERVGLQHSRTVLLFLMGQVPLLREEGSISAEETDAGIEEFFQQWSAFGRQMTLPEYPDFMLRERVFLRSKVLGCKVSVDCNNNLTSLCIAEALLGTLEALLATSLSFKIFPHLDRLNVTIDPEEDADIVPSLLFTDVDGQTTGIIRHRSNLSYATYEEATTFPNWLQEGVVQIFTKIAVPSDFENWAEAVLGNEQAFSRALTFSNIPSMASVIFGSAERLSVNDWDEASDKSYSVLRETPWRAPEPSGKERAASKPKFVEGAPPAGILDLEQMKHSDIHVISPIDVRKWEDAEWRGIFFQHVPGHPDYPPVLGIAFENIDAGQAIFQGLQGRFGLEDSKNEIRIAVIRGVRISNPHAYAVSIGANMDLLQPDESKLIEFGSRYHVLTPSASENLERFLVSFREHERYLLVPAKFNGVSAAPEPFFDFAIGKYELDVIDAWTIGPNNPYAMVLDPEDPPVVPMDQVDPPVLKALKWINELRQASNGY